MKINNQNKQKNNRKQKQNVRYNDSMEMVKQIRFKLKKWDETMERGGCVNLEKEKKHDDIGLGGATLSCLMRVINVTSNIEK